jgi:hypothetical protein
MSEELEDIVAQVLRSHDTGAVDVTALRVGSLTRARTIRRRRVGLAGAAVAAVMVGAGATAAAGPGGDGPPQLGGHPSPSASGPGADGVTTSLPLSDAPGAAVRPDLVGKAPGVLHFIVDTAAIGATGIDYGTRAGIESATAWNGAVGHFNTWYYLAQQRASLDTYDHLARLDQPHDPAVNTGVFGRPATLIRYPNGLDGKQPMYQISWQPADGLWARVDVEANDPDTAMKAVFALKLSRSQRCVVPMRLSSLPAGYTWSGCDVGFGPSKPWQTGDLWLTDAHGTELGLEIGNFTTDQPFAANTTVGSRPAQWIEQSPQHPGTLFIPVTDWVNVLITAVDSGGQPDGSFTKTDATQVAELIDIGTDFTDPTTWPATPVG